MIDYIIGIGVAALVVALVIRNIRRRKNGGSVGCGCGSSSWNSCSGCGCGCESSECKSSEGSSQQSPKAD